MISTLSLMRWTSSELRLGKIVCVGRNYAEHARELNNPVPAQPLLFIKPASSAIVLGESLPVPVNQGSCQHELEVSLLIGEKLKNADPAQCLEAIIGVGLGLDLTLRDVQNDCKKNGHPWETAKGFDGACPLTDFMEVHKVGELNKLEFYLKKNGQLQQKGCTSQMLFPIDKMLSEISRHFTLVPGDVVLTGTPAGVSSLVPGDELEVCLGGELIKVSARVVGA